MKRVLCAGVIVLLIAACSVTPSSGTVQRKQYTAAHQTTAIGVYAAPNDPPMVGMRKEGRNVLCLTAGSVLT
jgi:hypothetical protein